MALELCESLQWPPSYTIKKHRSAKYVKLRMTPKGLVITIPYRFSLREVPTVVEEHKQWIVTQLHQFALQPVVELPSAIFLAAIEQHWLIEYLACSTKLKLYQRPDQTLVVMGNISDKESCLKLLRKWVKAQAIMHLPTMLSTVSFQTGLVYSQVSVRDQRTLWGSCTVAKNISLNYKLLLLPANLAEHVLIHELAHTVFLNHSPKFWQLVAKHDQQFELHKKILRKANKLLPPWLN